MRLSFSGVICKEVSIAPVAELLGGVFCLSAAKITSLTGVVGRSISEQEFGGEVGGKRR